MTDIKFVGLDPSMSNLGLCRGVMDLEQNVVTMHDVHLIRTKPGQDKKVRKSADDYERCRTLLVNMHKLLTEWEPRVLFAEMPTGSQSANGMKSYGISICVMATINTPVIQLTPQMIKVAATGNKKASKADMMDWARELWPDINWRKNNGDEHCADACAAVHAGMQSDQWNQLLAMYGGQPSASVI